MTGLTVCPAREVTGWPIATKHVDTMRDRLKVREVYAGSDTTQVIDGPTGWNLSTIIPPHLRVGQPATSLTNSHPRVPVNAQVSAPDPTPCFGVNADPPRKPRIVQGVKPGSEAGLDSHIASVRFSDEDAALAGRSSGPRCNGCAAEGV